MRETPFVLLLGDDGSIRFINVLLLASAELIKGALKVKMADGTSFSIEGAVPQLPFTLTTSTSDGANSLTVPPNVAESVFTASTVP